MKIIEVIKKLEEYHPPLDRPETSDKVIYGDAQKECSGIVITCFASVDVIRKTAEVGANFIICHEPVFYSDKELTEGIQQNKVCQEKASLLDKTGIVIYRDHDHIHGGGPMQAERKYEDGIFYGIMKELGWENYVIGDRKKPLLYKIPEKTVQELADEFMEKLNLNGMRIVGATDSKVSTVFLCEHINGRHDEDVIHKAEEYKADVLIPLEIIDWTLSSYIRDSTYLNYPKTILEMGHFNFEEPGMKYMVSWLPGVIGNSMQIHYIQSGDSFNYLTRK